MWDYTTTDGSGFYHRRVTATYPTSRPRSLTQSSLPAHLRTEVVRGAPRHLQAHDASLDLTGDNSLPINTEQSKERIRSVNQRFKRGKGYGVDTGRNRWVITPEHDPCLGRDAPVIPGSGACGNLSKGGCDKDRIKDLLSMAL